MRVRNTMNPAHSNHTILMIGWEYPPHNSGGLGVASQAIAENLSKKGSKIIFTLPQKQQVVSTPGVDFMFADIPSVSGGRSLSEFSYITGQEGHGIDQEMIAKIMSYSDELLKKIDGIEFDFIHAHDWLTFPAALRISKATGKPLYVHMHATEFDRAGSKFGNASIHAIEYEGLQQSSKIFAVSEFTRQTVINHYNIHPDKVSVVYNGINTQSIPQPLNVEIASCRGKKTVLFVGRLTLQKGVDWFLHAAKAISDHRDDVIFMVTGSGDQQGSAVELASELGISSKVIFTGFMRNSELSTIYKHASVFVMPSVSEPFGITALEAASAGVPVIVSRTSGVSEVMRGAMKVDFWNTGEMAQKILGVLEHTPLQETLSIQGALDVKQLSWERTINQLLFEYSS